MKINRKKVSKVFGAIGATITIGVPLCAWWLEAASQHGLREIRQQIRHEGLPLTPADLQRPMPPANRNAALEYAQLTQLLKANPLSGEAAVLNEVKRDVPSPAGNMQQIRSALLLRRDVTALVHQAAQKPECNFNRDYSQGYNLLLPEYAAMRSGLRVLTNESALLLYDGKPLDAIRNETLGFAMAKHAQTDPILIGKLVSVALNAITLHFMERVLYTAGEQPGVAQAVENAVADNWQTVSMADGMRGELVADEVTFAQLRAGTLRDNDLKPGEKPDSTPHRSPSFVGTALMSANELHLLRYVHSSIAAASLPPRESQAKLDALEHEALRYEHLPTRSIAAIMVPVFSQARTKQTQGEAQQAVVHAAAAVMAYKQQNGRLPNTLNQAMQTVPADPFDQQPLRYRLDGDGFVVYSAGPTGKFDGGTANTKPNSYESVFRFPMPVWYTQAPTSAASASTPTP